MTYEMPVIARLSREELAQALDKPVDHPDVELLGGLNVVIHPMASPHVASVEKLSASMPAAGTQLSAVAKSVAGIEEALFERLRSNPNIAKQFLLAPLDTLESLGLIDTAMRSKLEEHAAVISKAIAPQ